MDRTKEAECASYFRKNPGFERTMQALWEKWRSYGRMAGEIWLKDPDPEEVKALEGYFGASVLKKGRLRFRAGEFEQALENTRFAGADMKKVLEEYFDAPLRSKKEEEAQLQAERERFFKSVLEEISILAEEQTGREGRPEDQIPPGPDGARCGSPAALRWLRTLSAQKLWQLRQNSDSEEECLQKVRHVSKALCMLETMDRTRGIRLAVLAMECTGSPHGFDRGTVSGNLLLGAIPVLASAENGKEAKTELSPRLAAEDALERYIECGIRPDDLSSFTILYRILLKDDSGPVKAYEAMAERREPVLVSLLNLRNIRAALPAGQIVYVVENQMVFSQLCEECPEASLMCTSGQVRTASLMVLDLLCREDVRIFYSGDLDPEGICIADRLISRSGGKIRPWHMTAEDYRASVSSVKLTDERLRELDHVKCPDLREAAETVKKEKKAGYQEKLLKMMKQEILSD